MKTLFTPFKQHLYTLFIIVTLTCFATSLHAQVTKTANVTTAGTLSTVASSYLSTVSNLTVTGTIDARDFKTMRDNMPILSVIDISNVTIAAYTGMAGTYGTDVNNTSTTYSANGIPKYSFVHVTNFDSYNRPYGISANSILKSIILPNSTTSIGTSAFSICTRITSITIPNSVNSIGTQTFNGCTGLTSIIIPSSVTSIGSEAFNGCSGLTSIYANPTTPVNLALTTSVFTGVSMSTCVLYVPIGSISAYKSATQWSSFTNITDGSPIVVSAVPSDISNTTATSGGNITFAGTSSVTTRGVCWSTVANPTTTNSKTTDGNGIGIFSSSIAGLTSGITYHIRAYATNSVGTSYGDDLTFMTLKLPIISTSTILSIAAVSATAGGNITDIGISNVTVRGVCWSKTINPTTADSTSSNGTGIGSFTCLMNGLTMGTTYHVRAYATNSAGTSYGSDVSFTTLSSSTQVYLNNIAFISLAQDGTQLNVPSTMTMNTTNPNNYVNPGNLVRFKMQCFNNKTNGTNIVSGSCKVRCKDPFITLTDSTSGLNNVGWNASAWSTDEFEIQILNTAPFGHVSYVDFIVVEGANSYYTYQIPILIAPLNLQTKTVDDDNNPDSHGNSNGICEPNEIIESLPTLQNVSSFSANTVSGIFGGYYGATSINVWNNKQGSSGTVVNNSYWNYAFGAPQVITAGSKDLLPQWDFVFDYNYTKTLHFKMGLAMSGSFNLFSGYKSYIKWLIPIDYNVGYPEFNTAISDNYIDNIDFYPNPTNGIININIGSGNFTDCLVNITNSLGQKVYNSKLYTEKTTLDLTKISKSGLLFIQIINNKGAVIAEKKILVK